MFRGTKRARSGARHWARRGAKQKTTMKEKPNYAELEKHIDFTALAGKLGQLTEQDNPQRKSVFSLLDRVREPILAARRNRKVSYQVLAKELTGGGIPVSEPTLRKYINGSVPAIRQLPLDTCSGGRDSGDGMARKLRIQYPGAVYHVMNRGDRRESIFQERGQ